MSRVKSYREAADTAERDRFVGFSFAGGDLLIEATPEGEIVFAAGASVSLLGVNISEMFGTTLASWFRDAYGTILGSALKASLDGARKGQIVAQTRAGEQVELSMCSLPRERSNVYISICDRHDVAGQDGETENLRFVDAAVSAIESDRGETAITLVDLSSPLLSDEEAGKDLQAELDLVLRSYLQANAVNADAATKLPSGQYGFIHTAGQDIADIVSEVEIIAMSLDPAMRNIRVRAGSLPTADLRENKTVARRALQRVLDNVCKEAFSGTGDKDVSAMFRASVEATQGRMGQVARMFANHEFGLHIQPIVSLSSEEVSHYEVLSRFRNGQSPFETVTFAEDTSLIQDLDNAVVERALKAIEHGQAPAAGGLAVNVSGVSLQSPAFIQRVLDLYTGASHAAGKFSVEITESAKIDNLDQVRHFVDRLRQAGIIVCLDDFGAGAASFQYLQALDVDCVKIDGLYVSRMLSNGKEYSMIRALADLCRDLNITTVAEYVEDARHVDALRGLNIDYAQGFYYGRPAPLEAQAQPKAAKKKPSDPGKLKTKKLGFIDSWA